MSRLGRNTVCDSYLFQSIYLIKFAIVFSFTQIMQCHKSEEKVKSAYEGLSYVGIIFITCSVVFLPHEGALKYSMCLITNLQSWQESSAVV